MLLSGIACSTHSRLSDSNQLQRLVSPGVSFVLIKDAIRVAMVPAAQQCKALGKVATQLVQTAYAGIPANNLTSAFHTPVRHSEVHTQLWRMSVLPRNLIPLLFNNPKRRQLHMVTVS